MRWLCGSATSVTLLALLLAGCGSTADDDRLLLRFIGFDDTGITQEDSVRANSADVDVIQDICAIDTEGNLTVEPFTQTTVNAIFVNEQAVDIRLERVRVDAGFQFSNLGLIEQSVSANVPGGRCSNADRGCAVDADCAVAGSTGTVGTAETCVHDETTVTGILLFDFVAKRAAADLEVLGKATNVSITFFGTDDTEQSFQVTTNYVVTFANFDNCEDTGGGQGGS